MPRFYKKKYISVNSVCSKQYVFLKHLYIASNKFIILDRYFAQLLKINLYRQNCLYDIHVYGLNNIVRHRTKNQSFVYLYKCYQFTEFKSDDHSLLSIMHEYIDCDFKGTHDCNKNLTFSFEVLMRVYMQSVATEQII